MNQYDSIEEDDITKDLWYEFENDDELEFPNGYESLSWLKESREFEQKLKQKEKQI